MMTLTYSKFKMDIRRRVDYTLYLYSDYDVRSIGGNILFFLATLNISD